MRAPPWLLLLSALLASAPAGAQRGSDALPLGELIEVVIRDDVFLAIDAESGGTTELARRLGERVLWTGTRGRIGVVITDERVLAVDTGAPRWREAPYERGEAPPPSAELGDRVALVALRRRVLGFASGTTRFAEVRLGPQEELHAARVGANVAVVVTDRQAFGLSPDAGGFFATRLQLREAIDGVGVRANLATVRTDRRLLVFRGPTGSWAERRH